jgi:hypothetical protein
MASVMGQRGTAGDLLTATSLAFGGMEGPMADKDLLSNT